MDEEERYIKEIMRQYPRLDRLMAKTIYDCYKAGTLDKIIEDRKALGDVELEKPKNLVLKTITID